MFGGQTFNISIVFILGLIFGSFANVVIYRLTHGELPWKPLFSYCPHCRKKIAIRDNIPILSFILLKGKCRFCRKPISLRYPLIEGLATIAMILVFWKISSLPNWSYAGLLSFMIFAFILLVVTAVDFLTFSIPDSLSLGLGLIMLASSFWNPFLGSEQPWQRFALSFMGASVYGVLFWLLAGIGRRIYKKEALGGGDVKLAIALGAALGVSGLYPVVVISSILGLAYAFPLIFARKIKIRDPIAYGPFLAVAAFVVFLLKGKLPSFLEFPSFY